MMMRLLSASSFGLVLLAGCSKPATSVAVSKPSEPAAYVVDAATAGSVRGVVTYKGAKIAAKRIDMSEDPACVKAGKGSTMDESLLLDKDGAVGNAFVYIEKGLEGKHFAAPVNEAVMDQRGCWFRPHVLGVMVGQPVKVINSDPVTHNIHPQAVANREWNHSQGEGEPPIIRRFTKAEVMIPVKCNIHAWMHAYIGVLDHPYFTVTAADGSFALPNLPPGNYTVAVWQEKLGTQHLDVTVPASGTAAANLTFAANTGLHR